MKSGGRWRPCCKSQIRGHRVTSKPTLPPASCAGLPPAAPAHTSVPGVWPGSCANGCPLGQTQGVRGGQPGHCFLLPWVGVARGKGLAGPTGGRGSHPQNQDCTLFARGVSTRTVSWPHATEDPLRQQPLWALALTGAHELTPRPESGVGPEPSPLPQTSKLVTSDPLCPLPRSEG